MHDEFPAKEKFREFFLLHPMLNNPGLHNKITIGCTIQMTIKIGELKLGMNPNTSMLPWLKNKLAFLRQIHLATMLLAQLAISLTSIHISCTGTH